MTAKRMVSSERRPVEPNEANPTSVKPDTVDALVSDFLVELSSLSSEIKEVQQPKVVEETPAGNATPSAAKTIKMQQHIDSDMDKEARFQPKLDLEEIQTEVEQSLIELEQLKSKVIAITDRRESKQEPLQPLADQKEFKPAPLSPLPGDLEQPAAAASTPMTAAVSDSAAAINNSEKQGSDWAEIFPTRIASPRVAPQRIKIVFALAVVVLVGILGYFYFHRTTSISIPIGQIPNSSANGSDKVAVGAEAHRNGPEDSIPISEATKSKKSQTTGSTNDLIPDREKAKSISKTAAKPNSSSNPSRPDSLPESTAGRTTEMPSVAFVAKPRVQEGPRPQTAPPDASGVSLPPTRSSQGVASPAVTVASQPPPDPVIPDTLTIATPENESVAPASPLPRELSPGAAQPVPSRNDDEASATARPKSASRASVIPVSAEAILRIQPTYPMIAKMQKVGGKVELETEINEKGDVIGVKAVAGPILLRKAAEEALIKWKFKPASINGVNVASQARIVMIFNLQ